jgi:hypothetical protein
MAQHLSACQRCNLSGSVETAIIYYYHPVSELAGAQDDAAY